MRLFIALNVPDQVRRDLWAAAEPLRAAAVPVKWVRPEGIHLTLKFLGPVADERGPELDAALGTAARGTRPLPLAIGGMGAFPNARTPRVIWTAVEPVPALELLQHQVERAFAPLGFATEARPFHPHLTLGRAARDARATDFAGFDRLLDTLRFEASVLVETVELMESLLQPGGAVYHPRHSERLS